MQIRPERPEDRAEVFNVNEKAFGRPEEPNLVDALRDQASPVISLVAEEAGRVVGHIMFSPVLLTGSPDLKVMGLGPMAVTPEHQRKGIGSRLVQAGLDACKELGYKAAVVLGHPAFYPRFGFVPAANFGIRSDYDVPDEVFMAIELTPGALLGASGVITYHPAFANV